MGLLNGVVVQAFPNPRAGLSAHLAAVQSALVLWALGLLWPRVDRALPKPEAHVLQLDAGRADFATCGEEALWHRCAGAQHRSR